MTFLVPVDLNWKPRHWHIGVRLENFVSPFLLVISLLVSVTLNILHIFGVNTSLDK